MYNGPMALTKTQLIDSLCTKSGLDKKTVASVLSGLSSLVQEQLQQGETVTLPDLAKFSLKEKPATPERQGVNPFTKAQITIAAKPATKKVIVKPVAGIKKAFA